MLMHVLRKYFGIILEIREQIDLHLQPSRPPDQLPSDVVHSGVWGV